MKLAKISSLVLTVGVASSQVVAHEDQDRSYVQSLRGAVKALDIAAGFVATDEVEDTAAGVVAMDEVKGALRSAKKTLGELCAKDTECDSGFCKMSRYNYCAKRNGA